MREVITGNRSRPYGKTLATKKRKSEVKTKFNARDRAIIIIRVSPPPQMTRSLCIRTLFPQSTEMGVCVRPCVGLPKTGVHRQGSARKSVLGPGGNLSGKQAVWPKQGLPSIDISQTT